MKISKGNAITFKYKKVEFLITIINNYYSCFAEGQFQWGAELGQFGHTETTDELIDMVKANYDNGNIYIED